MYSLLKHISHKKDNKLLLLKYLKKYSEEDAYAIIYEMSVMAQDGKPLTEIFKCLKEGKFGFEHTDFVDIAKKIKETDSFMLNSFEVEEGVNECSKCKSKRTISYSKQVRSSDEGASIFIYCIDCKHRYMMNS